MVAIWVTPTEATGSKSLIGGGQPAILKELDPKVLNESLKQLAQDIDIMFADTSTSGAFSLDQIEIGLEVTAEAGINLIGTAKAGGKASVSLSFSRSKQ